MKLLVLTAELERSTLDAAGGWMHELTSGLAARGHRVTVMCTRASEPREPLDAPDDPPGVTVWRPAEHDRAAALSGLLALEPDVVQLAAAGPLPTETFATIGDTPLVIDLLDWSALCPAADLLVRPHGEACLQHHPIAPCGTCVGHAHVRAMEPFLSLARAGHRLLAHTGHVRDRSTLALGRGVSLVPVGVDATRYTMQPAPPLAPEIAALASERSRPRVITLGPPTTSRGGPRFLDLLVALHARLPGVELVVPGTDADNPDLMHIQLAEAKELGIAQQLRALPRVSDADLPALLAACDVGAAPGVAPDPLGRALVQGLAAGLAIVAHPTPVSVDLLLQGDAGVLASALPMSRFADAVVALLKDASRRKAQGERARLAALERHDIERSIVDTEALLLGMRAAKRSPQYSRRRQAA